MNDHCLPNLQDRFITAIRTDSKYLQEAEETLRCLYDEHLSANTLLHVHQVAHTPLSLAILYLPHPDTSIALAPENALANSPYLVDLLVKQGAYIGTKEQIEKGMTQPEGAPLPLAFAVKCGQQHIVQQLVTLGAGLDVQGADGKTALHEAVLKRDMQSATVLLQAGARTDIVDNNGKTVADYEPNFTLKAERRAGTKPGVFAQLFEEAGKANHLEHGGIPQSMRGWGL